MPIIAKQTEQTDKDERLYKLRHSAAHLMAEAVIKLFPDAKLAFGPPIEDGFYYDFDTEHRFDELDLRKIEKQMERLRQKKAEFVCEPIAKAAALELFNSMGEKLKAEHVETLPDGTDSCISN